MDYIIVNGELTKSPESGYLPYFSNEPFVVTRKIWFGHGGIPLFSENLTNILQTLDVLRAPSPVYFDNERELFRITKRMLNKNKLYRSGIITIRLYIGTNKTDAIISGEAFRDSDFSISEQGLLLNFSETIKFSDNPLNRFSFFNAPQWQVSGAGIVNTPFNNTIFLNEKGLVTNCIGANIFAIKNKILFTPTEDTGCYIDVLLKQIIEVASTAGLEVAQTGLITRGDLMMMNEIFVASEAGGIQWVMGVENKRFVQRLSPKIHLELNKYLKEMVV